MLFEKSGDGLDGDLGDDFLCETLDKDPEFIHYKNDLSQQEFKVPNNLSFNKRLFLKKSSYETRENYFKRLYESAGIHD